MGEKSKGAIVVPQDTSTHGIECLRSLSRQGVHTIAVAESARNPAFRSRYCDEAIVGPSRQRNLDEYRDCLLALANRDDVRTIVPLVEEDVYVLSKHRTEFSEQIVPVWPSLRTLRTAHDRLELIEAAVDVGVPVPDTHLLSEIDAVDRDSIVKARYALLTEEYVDTIPPGKSYKTNHTVCLSPEVEIDRQRIRNRMKHDPIVQEFVEGDGIEYSCRVLCDRGEPIAFCMKHQIRGRSYGGGSSVYRESTYDQTLKELSTSLLRSIEWHGIASVCFIKDATTGAFKLTEINPRIPVSISMDVRAGVDFPYYLWQLATKDQVRVDSPYVRGVGTHDPIGEVRYLLSILTTDHPFTDRPSLWEKFREMTASVIAQPHFEYCYLDDPVPFFRSLSFRASKSTS